MREITNKVDEEPLKQEKQTDEHDVQNINPDTVKRQSAYSNLRRDLSDEDLNSPGTQRLLLNEIDKYGECAKQLEEYKVKYYTCDKEKAISETKLSSSTAFEILYSVSLSVGAMLIGLTPSLVENNMVGWFVGIVGVSLLTGGIIAKCVKK